MRNRIMRIKRRETKERNRNRGGKREEWEGKEEIKGKGSGIEVE